MRASLETFKSRFRLLGQRTSLLEIKERYVLSTASLAALLNVQDAHARHWQAETREMSDSQIELLYYKLKDLVSGQ